MATNDLGVIKINIDLSSLGTPDFTSSNDIVVYPNPTTDIINIKGGDNSINAIVIYSASGSLIAQYPANETISLAGLSPGVYFLKVSTEKGIYIKRVIKE